MSLDHVVPAGGIDPAAPRSVAGSMLRGARCRCPACGEGALYGRYLKVEASCARCGEDLTHQRADDAPAYFTIFIVGHIVAGAALTVEQKITPPIWVHLTMWLPLTVVLSLLLLPRIKGALIGLQWANRMHGFGGQEEQPESDPAAAMDPARDRTGSRP